MFHSFSLTFLSGTTRTIQQNSKHSFVVNGPVSAALVYSINKVKQHGLFYRQLRRIFWEVAEKYFIQNTEFSIRAGSKLTFTLQGFTISCFVFYTYKL